MKNSGTRSTVLPLWEVGSATSSAAATALIALIIFVVCDYYWCYVRHRR